MSSIEQTTPVGTAEGFAELGLSPALLKTLAAANYNQPTPIQAQAIPPVLAGHDLLGIAQTGTGKTAAFALPILQKLAANRIRPPARGCRVLVLSPTRELASQIALSFKTYGKGLNLSVAVIFGGVGYGPQRAALNKGIDVLVAAPGRLMDHMDERVADLSNTEIFVLDEADQMLDLGFIKPIQRIVKTLPQRRQNLFFSATMPKEIGALADELLRNPVKVAVTPVAKTADRVSQRVVHITAGAKAQALVDLVEAENVEKGIVFTRTKRGADRVAKNLEEAGISAVAIHGNKSQSQREKAMDFFRKGKARLLIATDIAARGIDIPAVSHVINYELPEVAEAYVHRIGRTARAGAEGQAVAFCAPDEQSLLRAIEKLTRQSIPAEWRDVSPDAPAVARPPRGQQRGGGGGGRPQGARPPQRQGGGGFGGRSFGGGGFKGGRPQGERFGEERPRAERFASVRAPERAAPERAYEERAPQRENQHQDRPRDDRPRGDRPYGGRTQEGRSHSDRAPERRPEGGRSFEGARSYEGGRPAAGRPAAGRPAGDRPQGDRGFGGRSEGQRSGAGRSFSGGRPEGGEQGKKPFWKKRSRPAQGRAS
jgi:ATP-dependent RNA helicase RhlE